MYTDNLTTPHERKVADGESIRPLLEVVDPEQIGQYLGHVSMQGTSVELRGSAIEAANDVARHVQRSLWFPIVSGKDKRNDFEEMSLDYSLPLRHVTEKQVADCFGYSVVTSECLERASIEHWVGFANGHATLVLPNQQDDGLYLLDPLTPGLNQDMKRATGTSPAEVKQQIAEHGRGATWLNTHQVAISSKQEFDEAFDKNPWLTFSKSSAISVNSDSKVSEKRVIMSLFDPGVGRKALSAYKDFMQHVELDDYQQASGVLGTIPGLFPEIDLRNPQRDIRRLVGVLSQQGRTGQALKAVDDYFSSFILSRDSRALQAKGDSLRKIAENARSFHVARMAIDAYGEAARMPKAHRAAIKGKRAKAEELLAQIQTV